MCRLSFVVSRQHYLSGWLPTAEFHNPAAGEFRKNVRVAFLRSTQSAERLVWLWLFGCIALPSISTWPRFRLSKKEGGSTPLTPPCARGVRSFCSHAGSWMIIGLTPFSFLMGVENRDKWKHCQEFKFQICVHLKTYTKALKRSTHTHVTGVLTESRDGFK